jgi:trans-aconitate methyltransferase
MTTHQSISGQTDDDLLQRVIRTDPNRFGDAYWAVFDQHVLPRLGSAPAVVDLGCGQGLFLRDGSHRLHKARLHGLDTLVRAAVELPKENLH